MKSINVVAFACASFIATIAQSQPVFSYGNKTVNKTEFLNAFNKNPNPDVDKKKALNEYLNLYINYKLKVQAAYDEKLNEQPALKMESENFKKQIAENVINEEANVKSLVKEAFERSQKDIYVAQIFIAFGKDTAEAYKKAQAAYTQLKAGKNFGETAVQCSTDEGTKQNKGNVGYITVFSLPYEFENEIYKLKPGTYSAPYKSKIGYHILKNVSERPAVGRRKVEQILLAFPPDANAEEKKSITHLADSLYNVISKGESFEAMARQFSNDNFSAMNGGLMPEIGVSQYSKDFEEQVFGLKKVNDVSKPFASNYGYHILKLIEIIAVSKNTEDVFTTASLKQKVESSDRISAAKKNLINKWMVAVKYKKALYDEKELWRYVDSFTYNKPLSSFKKVKDSTVIFSFAKQKYYAVDFAKYTRSLKQSNNAWASKSYTDILKEFTQSSCAEYYRNHLEEYNASMKQQAKEFGEANLLFASMDKHVWGKAGQDSVGLKNYYNQNKVKYQWQPGVAALVITAVNKELATEVAEKIKNNPANWRLITVSYGTNVIADSSRYELSQLPVKQKIESVKGFISSPEKNGTEEMYTFIYVAEVFSTPSQRSFDEARGLVINDYQQQLEEKWLAELKKKYPVKINQEVWKTIK
jgi:peptidyl-prolyl cis-trans isomerase SurA